MFRRLLGVFCALILFAGSASAAELQKISVGYVPVADFAPLFVAKDKGFFEKKGLDLTLTKILLASNVPGALVAGSLDIGMGTPPMLLVTNESGLDFEAIAAVSRLKKENPFVSLIARPQANIKEAADLKGKKLGVFGGPSSTTFAFLSVLAKNWYGIDLFKEAELVTAPAPALAELLGKGDIDAALLGTVESIQTFAQDRYRVLADLSGEYKAHQGGRAPAHVVVATNEEFAKAHPDIVRDYLKAYKGGQQYVHDHPEVWDEYAASIKMDNPAERKLLREKMGPNLVERWDAEQIALQNDYLKLVHNIIGDSVVKVVPTDLIRNDYIP